MINDNKNDFMAVVNSMADEYKQRSYESCVEGFMTSMIKEAVTIDIPKNLELGFDEKNAMLNNVTSTIKASASEFTKNAISDTETLYNVNLAKEIVNPKNFTESVMQLVSAHIFDEANDRITVLEADFDSGKINNMSFEDAASYVESTFEPLFSNHFDNGKRLKKHLNLLMSTEGTELVSDIKDTVSKMVLETEAKNSVIREAISEINETKAEIEKKINGETDEEKEVKEESEKESNNDNNSEDDSNNEDNDNVDDDNFTSEKNNSEDQAVEGYYLNSVRKNKRNPVSITYNDLFRIRNIGGVSIQSGEDWSTNYDNTSFSREAAENILDQFRELDDGIDADSINDDEAFSMSDDDGGDYIDNEGDELAESSEKEYEDDDGNVIEEFQASYDDEIKPDPIPSIENLSKAILPMNLRKIGTNKFEPSSKLVAYLALQEDNGRKFFDVMNNRKVHALELLDKTQTDVIEGLAKSDIEKQLSETCDKIDQTEEGVSKLLEDMGIAGILDDKFQRSADPVQNAVKSLFNPNILKASKYSTDISAEELHEHELADIFKLAVKVSEVKSEIVNRSDVLGNKDQLGYLEELLNEKMFNLEPNEKFEVQNKIDALQSIESQIKLSDLMDINVFCSSYNDCNKTEGIKLESLKDIDSYGFSFYDESEKIKQSIRVNWRDKLKNDGIKYNVDTDKLVEFVLDEQDTTKIDSNIFEKALSKLAADKLIESSTEALILRNKAKAITASYLAADKLGFLTKEDIKDIRNYVLL